MKFADDDYNNQPEVIAWFERPRDQRPAVGSPEHEAQWQAFKTRLDNNLNIVIADDSGSYQASQLTFLSDYALGYQILKDSDPQTAAHAAATIDTTPITRQLTGTARLARSPNCSAIRSSTKIRVRST